MNPAQVDLSFDALRRGYARGVRVRDVVDAMCDRWIDAPPGVWISIAGTDEWRRRARELDALPTDIAATLPLFGVPIAIKDNIDVVGFPTTAGCPRFAREPDRDAEVVTTLRAAGALIVGKTNLDQFATGLTGTRTPYGVAPNPIVPGLVPGGSSSGSAVAVALGLVTFALGTDTAGSGRVPAACTETFAWKPAPGTWPVAGVVPACRSLDCVSLFAATPDDLVDLASVLHRERISGFSGRLRVAVPDAAALATMTPDAAAATTVAIDALRRRGVDTVAVDVEAWFEVGAALYGGPWVAERTAGLGDFIARHPDDVVPVVRDIILGGANASAVDVFRAQDRLAQLARTVRQWFDDVDALVMPTCDGIPTVAAAIDDPSGSSVALGRWTNAANLVGLASVSFPAARRTDGQPFGLTAFAPPGRDRALATLAGALPDSAPTAVGPYDLAVVGAHLSGEPLNDRLTRRGARLVASTSTAAAYRLWRLAEPGEGAGPGRATSGPGVPPRPKLERPGLERVAEGGASIEVEVWRLDAAGFAAVVSEIPPPLGIGSVELADGTWVRGFVCEPIGFERAQDITGFGGWRAALRANSG